MVENRKGQKTRDWAGAISPCQLDLIHTCTIDLARIGPYVVYMEAYDLNGNVEKFRKSAVLAHRL